MKLLWRLQVLQPRQGFVSRSLIRTSPVFAPAFCAPAMICSIRVWLLPPFRRVVAIPTIFIRTGRVISRTGGLKELCDGGDTVSERKAWGQKTRLQGGQGICRGFSIFPEYFLLRSQIFTFRPPISRRKWFASADSRLIFPNESGARHR